jgi:hypothetical protein
MVTSTLRALYRRGKNHEGRVGNRAGLDVLGKRDIYFTCRESNDPSAVQSAA